MARSGIFNKLLFLMIINVIFFSCDNLISTSNNTNNPTTYSVTFDSNGGSTVSSITGITAESSISIPDDPHKDYYVFDGWFLDDETFLQEFTSETTVNSNITVYAKWIWNTINMTVQSDLSLQGKIYLGEVFTENLLNDTIYSVTITGHYDNLPPDTDAMGIFLRDATSQINTNDAVEVWEAGDWKSKWNNDNTFILNNLLKTNTAYSYPFPERVILGIWLSGENGLAEGSIYLTLNDVSVSMTEKVYAP